MSIVYNNYNSVVVGDMLLRLPSIKHVSQLPCLEKVVLHWSMKDLGITSNHLPAAWSALYIITGQVPVLVESRKSVAQWRRRKGEYVSVMVTLRGKQIYSVLDTCLNVVFPQTRPFKGFDVSLMDRTGSCTVPIDQPILFPGLIEYYESYVPLFSAPGRSITLHTNCSSAEAGKALLTAMQIPIIVK